MGVLVFFIAFLLPIAFSQAATVLVNPDVLFKSRTTGGFITFTSAQIPTLVTIADNFCYFYNPLTGYSVIGVDASTGLNITITAIGSYDLTYSTVQSGSKTARFYLPRATPTVTGASSSTWDQTTSILTIVTNGASDVEVHWSLTSSSVSDTANILIWMFPLIFLLTTFSLIKNPGEWRSILTVAMLIVVIGFFGWLFLSWGM
jgi:hypothetical protein